MLTKKKIVVSNDLEEGFLFEYEHLNNENTFVNMIPYVNVGNYLTNFIKNSDFKWSQQFSIRNLRIRNNLSHVVYKNSIILHLKYKFDLFKTNYILLLQRKWKRLKKVLKRNKFYKILNKYILFNLFFKFLSKLIFLIKCETNNNRSDILLISSKQKLSQFDLNTTSFNLTKTFFKYYWKYNNFLLILKKFNYIRSFFYSYYTTYSVFIDESVFKLNQFSEVNLNTYPLYLSYNYIFKIPSDLDLFFNKLKKLINFLFIELEFYYIKLYIIELYKITINSILFKILLRYVNY